MRLRIAGLAAPLLMTTTGATAAEPASVAIPFPVTGVQPTIEPAQAQPDGMVTFRFQAPTASDVSVFLPNQSPPMHRMAKDSDGIWTVAAGPFAPEIYDYFFVMGGVRVKGGSFVVPDKGPRLYDLLKVAHGSITAQRYYSKVQDRQRRMNIYLPPEYYAQPKRRFPVLYLFNGTNEDEWVRIGRLDLLMDNLIAQGRAVPMIVVMPNNTTGPVPRPALENAAIMEREIMGEIVPWIDRAFRTIARREQRAIAGVSFGGGTAFTVGMRHLDAFAYVGEFGTGAFGGGERTSFAPGYGDYDPAKIAPDLYARLTAPATRPRLFYMTVGDADPRAPFQKKALADFKAHGFDPLFRTYPGAHEWRVFRPSLEDMAPMLFK